ncbi:MAG TPA: phosphate/phosphite/phosphonate ABC transporter substrate-binding protein [Nitrospirota bacterium]|nr:phosphate/phosphite/phosphonate ABC transporter substrate-binding protein [Nitrospirota bacterium]
MRRYIILILSVVLVVSLFIAPAAWAKDKLVMGVHPYKPVSDLYKMFKPIADYVSQKTGKPVEFRIGKTYAETVDAVGKGEMDFAFIGPSLYVEARSKYNVTPLAQIVNDGKPSFYGVIAVKKGSGISSIKELKGRTFTFGDRESTLTHIVPLYMLMDAGVQLADLKQYSFVGTHDNVALNVVRGSFDAAGLQPDVAAKYKDQGLEVIARSADLPEHVFVAAKSLDAATMTKIQTALLVMDSTLLKGIKGSVTGIQKFSDKDFDVLRKVMKAVEKEKMK